MKGIKEIILYYIITNTHPQTTHIAYAVTASRNWFPASLQSLFGVCYHQLTVQGHVMRTLQMIPVVYTNDP